jgi:hypothetical protein
LAAGRALNFVVQMVTQTETPGAAARIVKLFAFWRGLVRPILSTATLVRAARLPTFRGRLYHAFIPCEEQSDNKHYSHFDSFELFLELVGG